MGLLKTADALRNYGTHQYVNKHGPNDVKTLLKESNYYLNKDKNDSLENDFDIFVEHVKNKNPGYKYEDWPALWDEFMYAIKGLANGDVDFAKPGTAEHELTEPLAEKIDESDGKKDGKFSVHNIDCYDGKHNDELDPELVADRIEDDGPKDDIPEYDEDGNVNTIQNIVKAFKMGPGGD